MHSRYVTTPVAILLATALLVGPPSLTRATAAAGDEHSDAIGRTPPRLSYVDGDVGFWRPGAEDWAPAQINTPLAPGDELYTGRKGTLELQVDERGFVRASGDTQLGLANHELEFLQLKVTGGHVSLDLRRVAPGRTVELDTPHAAFTIERAGYYRVDVTPERTSFVTRRAGQATMMPAGGQPITVGPREAVVIEGAPAATVQRYAAPDLDPWDQWNYARTDRLLDPASARYVPSSVYGLEDLDRHGTWRGTDTYGAVWTPTAVPAGWAPYSTGKWIWDPLYGWTWVDTAAWGWAPYHHGRWVVLDGSWAWAPGPAAVRPVYAPALVAFFDGSGVHASVSVGAPSVSWVALGWGEPLVPWWGRPGFVGRPWWGGWAGPRVVNNVVINRTSVVNVNTITVYQNVSVQNAVVAVRHEHFGRSDVRESRVAHVDVRRLEPVRGALRVTPDARSFVVRSGRAVRPPESTISRPVVATRPASQPTALRRAEDGERRTGNAPQRGDESRERRSERWRGVEPTREPAQSKPEPRDRVTQPQPVQPTQSGEPARPHAVRPLERTLERAPGERAQATRPEITQPPQSPPPARPDRMPSPDRIAQPQPGERTEILRPELARPQPAPAPHRMPEQIARPQPGEPAQVTRPEPAQPQPIPPAQPHRMPPPRRAEQSQPVEPAPITHPQLAQPAQPASPAQVQRVQPPRRAEQSQPAEPPRPQPPLHAARPVPMEVPRHHPAPPPQQAAQPQPAPPARPAQPAPVPPDRTVRPSQSAPPPPAPRVEPPQPLRRPVPIEAANGNPVQTANRPAPARAEKAPADRERREHGAGSNGRPAEEQERGRR